MKLICLKLESMDITTRQAGNQLKANWFEY